MERARRVWVDVRFPVSLFLFTRVAYMAMSFMGLQLVPSLYFNEWGRQQFLQPYPWIDGLCRWDCGWFVIIKEQGYSTLENAKVFPLLPAIGWVMDKLFGIHHLITFIVVANLATLGAFIVLWKLFREFEGDDAARAGLTLFAAYPFSFFQAAAYPESLMIFFSAFAFLLARRGHHWAAGFSLAAGMLSRHITLFLGPSLFAEQVRQRGPSPKKILFHPAILSLGVPIASLVGFFFYLKVQTGDFWAALASRHIGWNDWVWYGVRQTLLYVPYHERPEYFFYMPFALIPAIGAYALLRKREWWVLAAGGTLLMTMILSTGIAGLGRYSASVWPAFLPLGVFFSRRPSLLWPLIVVFAMCNGFFFFLFSHQYRIF